MKIETLRTDWYDNLPDLDCPRCRKGIFIFDSKTLVELEDGISSASNCFEQGPTYYSGKFSNHGNCSNPKCEETAIIAGLTKYKFAGYNEGGYDIETGLEIPHHEMHEMVFKIELINPVIMLIKAPKSMPRELEEKIFESFKLFWIDKDSCGNKIRSAIEILLDFLKVKKSTINKKGKRERLSLHQRILIFQTKELELANNLLAIKWIGNTSSHNQNGAVKDKILDAYEILEFVLEKIFEGSVQKTVSIKIF